MNSVPKISPQQLFCVLLLSRISAEIVYPRTSAGTALDSLAALLIAEGIRFLLALPVIIYSFEGENFHRAVYGRNKFFGMAGAIISAILLVGAAVHTMYNTALFAVKSSSAKTAMWVIFLIVAGFAVYGAFMGVEALSRTAAIVLVGSAIVIAAVMLGDIPQISAESFAAMTEKASFDSLIADVINRLLRGGDYLIFAALLPFIEPKNREKPSSRARCVLLFALVSTAVSAVICAFNCLVLRQLYGLCEYPILASSSLSDVALFKRLDGITAAAWTLAASMRGAFMLLAARVAPRDVFIVGNQNRASSEKEAAK